MGQTLNHVGFGGFCTNQFMLVVPGIFQDQITNNPICIAKSTLNCRKKDGVFRA